LILLLAAGSSNSSTLSDVEPGLLGFLVVAALALALVFLLRSMNKQFRKIGPAPEDVEETTAAAQDEAQSPGTAAPGAAEATVDAPGSEANVGRYRLAGMAPRTQEEPV
jgi:hypothetical protein